MERRYKYYQSDFGKIKVQVEHMDLVFDIYDGHTVVDSEIRLKAREPLSELGLDADSLEILEVESSPGSGFGYHPDQKKLVLKFGKEVQEGEEIRIRTKSICKPTSNILEGLYYDETPAGCPPTQITQCQQWGFQRLVPCIDEMDAKATYTTRIIADPRYTHMITNGDVAVPRTLRPDGRAEITYHNTRTPMAPYLFFLGVGTYESFTREVEYPSGRRFILELLVPPGSSKGSAEKALDILWHGILWINIYTGPEQYKDVDKRDVLFDLVLKKGDQDRIRELAGSLRLGYEYTGSVYREIAMQNSNFGGMENVGNTTISANRIMPFPQMTDGYFEYMIRVKAHEFYHNVNGSEVTGRSPFELWLNEAVTCHVERKYHAFVAGEEYSRLQEVARIISPMQGTFDEDSGSLAMPIIPEGFNSPDELISNVTYSKAPEFVRMVEQLIGKEVFARGLHRYHTRYRHSNASTDDWIRCMEEESGIPLQEMARSWLRQTGYPVVNVEREEKDGMSHLRLRQEGYKEAPWQFPFDAAAVDDRGVDIDQNSILFRRKDENMLLKKGAFISFARGMSFYGKIEHGATVAELAKQALLDHDAINRFRAWIRLSQIELDRLVDDPATEPHPSFIALFFQLVSDDRFRHLGAMHVQIFPTLEDRKKKHMYESLYQARKRIQKALAVAHKDALLKLYDESAPLKASTIEEEVREIKRRQLRNLALGILSEIDTPDIHDMIRKQFQSSNMTEKLVAFSLYLKSNAHDKDRMLKEFMEESSSSLVTWESFLSAVGSSEGDDAIGLIKEVERSPRFRIEQANDQRALFMRFAFNKRKSLQTEEGRAYLKDILIRLSRINEYNTMHIVSIFSHLDDLPESQVLHDLLKDVLGSLDQKKTPSVYNSIRKILADSAHSRVSRS